MTKQVRYWTEENIPTIKELLEEAIDKKLTKSETLVLFDEKGDIRVTYVTIKRWAKELGLEIVNSTNKKFRNYAKGKLTFPNQIMGDIPGETFVPIILPNLDCTPYTVSQYGNVTGKRGEKLKWTSRGGYPAVNLRVENDRFKNYHHIPWQPGEDCKNLTKMNFNIHTLVGKLFIEKPIPDIFKDIWDTLTQEQKDWTQSNYVLDHIDDDKSNPHITNLRWIPSIENIQQFKAFKKNLPNG